MHEVLRLWVESMLDDLRGLRYPGGKNSATGMAQWVNGWLPQSKTATYVEPFAGMLGVLLLRDASTTEIVNDTDENLINWWECVRTKPDEMYHQCAFTPFSETLFKRHQATLNEGTDVERAAKFYAVTLGSFTASTGPGATFAVQYTNKMYDRKLGPARRASRMDSWLGRLHRVADRLRNVQILNRDAIRILDRLKDERGAIIYCDPPYPSVTTAYADGDLDMDAMTDVLLAQVGYTAISGVGTEWDHLGWWRRERPIQRRMGVAKYGDKAKKDSEVLWMNYDPEAMNEYKEGMQHELV